MTMDPAVQERLRRRRQHAYYYRHLERLAARSLGQGGRVLDLACETPDLLAALDPDVGVGLCAGEAFASEARRREPRYRYVVGDAELVPLRGVFDTILLPNVVGRLHDVQAALRRIREICHVGTKVFVTYYNFVWEPVLRTGARIGLKQPEPDLNWFGLADLDNVLRLAGYEVVARDTSLLLPLHVPLVSEVLERYVQPFGPFRAVSLVQRFIARPREVPALSGLSCSVVVPVRNEVENIAPCLDRMPRMGPRTEVIFVDGASTDGTRARIVERAARAPAGVEVKLIDQVPGAGVTQGGGRVSMLELGKGDAVRKGFAAATGDVLVILDGDLTVPPDDLPKFYEVLARGEADFANGSRLVYPLEEGAMRPFNLLANRVFGVIFTWLLGQRVKDTLCGTKALRRVDYERIAAGRAYFGDFDPFGDFDLLFGAARSGLRIVEVPVRYRRRTYGHTKVRVLEHGVLLARMVLVGLWQLKLRPALLGRRGTRLR